MKKGLGVFAFLLVFSIAFVSAGPVQGVEQLLDGLREIIYLVMEALFDISRDLENYDAQFSTKIIIGVIIFLVVYTIIKKNKILGSDKDKNPINIIVSLAITFLSVRYLPTEYVEAILIPYSALGVALSVFLPLLIFFLFLHQSNIGYLGRRIGWVVFGTSFIALWWTRYDYLESANWIYITGIIVIFFCFIFDRRIHRYFGLADVKKFAAMTKDKQHLHWKRELVQLEEDYRQGVIDQERYNRERPILEKRITDTAP